jgi:SAM-dependent methyltransferase
MRAALRAVAPIPEPLLALHHERLAFDRQLRDGRALASSMQIGPGMRVLQLDCGTGVLAEELADTVGPQGEVVGLDPMPLRVQMAHQRSRHNLRFQVGDSARLGRLPTASFDAVIANGVLHGWSDVVAAVAECIRLLAPGGCLGMCTQSAAHPHPAAQVRDAVLSQPAYARHAPPPEASTRPLTAFELDALLRKTGFASICLRSEPEVFLHAGARSAIEFMQAGAWGRFLTHLPERERLAADAEIVDRLDALGGPDGIRHDAVRLVAVAWKARHAPDPTGRDGSTAWMLRDGADAANPGSMHGRAR